MKKIIKVENLFTPQEVANLALSIKKPGVTEHIDNELGRIRYEGITVRRSVEEKLIDFVYEQTGQTNLIMNMPPQYVEYNRQYGEPNLRPHFDRDFNEYIIDYQLESNTSWPLGVDLDVYEMPDNSAVLFRPNDSIHWRPRKNFEYGEYVKMLFFRFFDPINPADNSHLPHNPADEMFDEVNALRDSLD
jgi:hypothetical protein